MKKLNRSCFSLYIMNFHIIRHSAPSKWSNNAPKVSNRVLSLPPILITYLQSSFNIFPFLDSLTSRIGSSPTFPANRTDSCRLMYILVNSSFERRLSLSSSKTWWSYNTTEEVCSLAILSKTASQFNRQNGEIKYHIVWQWKTTLPLQ